MFSSGEPYAGKENRGTGWGGPLPLRGRGRQLHPQDTGLQKGPAAVTKRLGPGAAGWYPPAASTSLALAGVWLHAKPSLPSAVCPLWQDGCPQGPASQDGDFLPALGRQSQSVPFGFSLEVSHSQGEGKGPWGCLGRVWAASSTPLPLCQAHTGLGQGFGSSSGGHPLLLVPVLLRGRQAPGVL